MGLTIFGATFDPSGTLREFNVSLSLKESGKSKWGLSKWGLKALVHDCLRLSSFCDEKFPLERGPKRPQKYTIVDDCAQIAESGLKPAFESPRLDFPKGAFWRHTAHRDGHQSHQGMRRRVASLDAP